VRFGKVQNARPCLLRQIEQGPRAFGAECCDQVSRALRGPWGDE
jgi:hypothetical protein